MQIRNFDSLLNAKLLWTAALVASFVVSTALQAAPDEIVVFTDEFEKKGEVGYELHLNYAARAQDTGLPRRASAVSRVPFDAGGRMGAERYMELRIARSFVL